MYLKFAWRYFKAKKSANAINIIAWVTVGVIAFAVACQILVLSVFNGFEGLVKSLYNSFYTDLKVVPAKGKTFLLTPDQLAKMKHQHGIESVSLIAEEKAILQNLDDTLQTIISLKGVDSNYSITADVAAKVFDGRFNTGTVDSPLIVLGAGVQNAVAVSLLSNLAPTHLSVILPKKVKLSVLDPMNALSEGNVYASGVFAIQQDFDNKYAITNIGFVKQQMGYADNEFSAVEIRLNPLFHVQEAADSLQKLLGPYVTVQTKYQQNYTLYDTMRIEKWAIYVILTLVLLISAFTMISSLTMLVLEKQQDINVLRSLGTSNPLIQKIFLAEGLLLGGIGAVIGILLALLVCFLQVKYKLIKLEGGSFLIDYFPVKLFFPDFLLVTGTVMVITFLASWYPSYKAARQPFELK